MTVTKITLPANEWVDLYAATSGAGKIEVGERMAIGCEFSASIQLHAGEYEPDSDAGYRTMQGRGYYANDTGDFGAWARSVGVAVDVTLMAVASNESVPASSWRYNFDGVDDYIQLDEDLVLSGDYYITFTVDYENLGQSDYVRAYGSDDDYYSRILIWNTGMISWNPEAGDTRIDTPEGVITPGLHEITVSRVGGTGYVYVDGVEVYSGAVPTGDAVIGAIGKQSVSITANCSLWDFDFNNQLQVPIDDGPGVIEATNINGVGVGSYVNFNDENWSPTASAIDEAVLLTDDLQITDDNFLTDDGVLQ